MAKIPDKAEHQRQFAALPLIERRVIIKAVNRGRTLENRKHAALAVGVARRQQRFWRFAWLIGPVVGLGRLFGDTDLAAALANAAVATLALVLMSWYWHSRARRAEVGNLAVVERRSRKGSTDGSDTRSAGERFRSHLPTGSRGAVERETSGGRDRSLEAGPTPPTPTGQRPYRPRGNKRR